jgi:hypothetical protein
MILMYLLFALVLVQSLTLAMLGSSAALARLGGDRRAAIEATLILEGSLAEARVDHQATIAALAPGEVRVLALSPPAGWVTHATASRENHGELVLLAVSVARYGAAGHLQASRRGTLILALVAADTAIVIDSRPRF